jgi:DNA-binding NtrC family response regulator
MTAANPFNARQRTVLLVGHPCTEVTVFADQACHLGWRTMFCTDLAEANSMLDTSSELQTSAIILDQDAVQGPIGEAIADLRRRERNLGIVAIASSASSRWFFDALRAGAGDCVAKPVTPDQLLQLLRKATSRAYDHLRERDSWADQLELGLGFDSMIEADPSFRAAWAQTEKIARANVHVLIEGEPGTGKDLLARAIHAASPRSRMPLKHGDFSHTTASQIEAALFGYERGAFVGAFDARPGLLEQSHGATLILNDVDDLPIPIQDRLAEALSDRRALRLGSAAAYCFDVRIIALGDDPIAELVESKAFSTELYRKFESARIYLPPLRKRREDVSLIARAFVSTFRDPRDLRMLAIDDDALALLRGLDWPGNSRQLLAVLLRAVAMATDHVLTRADFVELAGSAMPGKAVRLDPSQSATPEMKICTEEGHMRSLDDIEADVIRFAIERYGGRMAEVARRLKIGRSTLYRKARQLGFEGIYGANARD